MDPSITFSRFAKQGSNLNVASNNCVIYTRVSTKEQSENNQSLETQKKYCEELSKKKALNIVEYFGGTYESAKDDDRKEFNRMFKFILNKNNKINFIVVYSLDRFSRSGGNAINLSEKLGRQGIQIISVTQQVETTTPSGKFQESMFMMFSKFDNDMRRDKTLTGMIEMLKNGFWPTKAPVGYSHVSGKKGAERIIINDKGVFIKKAFLWKANEQLPNNEIILRLSKLGFEVSKQGLNEVLKNPFYCGILSHNLLKGEVVKSKHPAIVSEEIFLRANEIKSSGHIGYKQSKVNENLPLKKFVKCDVCGTSYAGYLVKAKGLYYYKCNRTGCKCNDNAQAMHEQFLNLLEKFHVEEKMISPMKQAMVSAFHKMCRQKTDESKLYRTHLKQIEDGVEKLEERFALGDIDRPMFEKFMAKYALEKTEIERSIGQTEINLSNLEKYIQFTLQLCSKLPSMWASGSIDQKIKLQNLIFPEGILYNREKRSYRTTRINSLFASIPLPARDSGKKKNGPSKKFSAKSAWVAGARLELTTFGL